MFSDRALETNQLYTWGGVMEHLLCSTDSRPVCTGIVKHSSGKLENSKRCSSLLVHNMREKSQSPKKVDKTKTPILDVDDAFLTGVVPANADTSSANARNRVLKRDILEDTGRSRHR